MPTDIICISTHYWNDFWFRKQQFIYRCIRDGYRVLYVQPSFSMVRQNPKPQIARNRWFFPLVEKIGERLYLFSPPRQLPKPNTPLISAINYQWFGKLVGYTAKKMHINNAILWVYQPEYADSFKYIPHSRLILDLADDLAAYKNQLYQYQYIERCIEKLAVSADIMVVTSPTLLDKYEDKARHCVLVPNGFDEKLFDGREKATPVDLSDISHPIVGFVGVLFAFLDYDLLFKCADSLPNVSFVFVGPVEKSGRAGVELLKSLANTYFLGAKARQAIPAYVTNFDVCINPFKVDNVSRAVSPLKVYEYLACGKPVVSTPMEGLARDEAGKWIQFSENPCFIEKLKETLAKACPSKIDMECVYAAQSFSWSKQFDKLKMHLDY